MSFISRWLYLSKGLVLSKLLSMKRELKLFLKYFQTWYIRVLLVKQNQWEIPLCVCVCTHNNAGVGVRREKGRSRELAYMIIRCLSESKLLRTGWNCYPLAEFLLCQGRLQFYLLIESSPSRLSRTIFLKLTDCVL